MSDIPHEGDEKPAAEFWITLALLTLATIIALILLHDGRTDQRNVEKKTTFFYRTVVDSYGA